MFDRLLPRGSTHLAMTFNAIGFLSEKPLDRLPCYILPNGPSRLRGIGRVSEEERRIFRQRAAEDIRAFLVGARRGARSGREAPVAGLRRGRRPAHL